MRVLRGLSFEQLPCGCLAGIYETYGGDVVTILDVKAAECGQTRHQVDAVVARKPPLAARRAALGRDEAVPRSA